MGQAKTKVNIIVCGLDNSGKTTLINFLKPEQEQTDNIAATVGYSMETFTKGKVKFTAFDMGGAKKFRSLWEGYYPAVRGVVFVIDSTDTLRMCVAKDEIEQMLAHPDLKERANVPILFFANKMDLDGAKTPSQITQILELSRLIGNRPFNFFSSNALTGEGVEEGMQWLSDTIVRQRKSNKK